MNVVETRDILCEYLPLIPFTRAQYSNCVSYVYATALQKRAWKKRKLTPLRTNAREYVVRNHVTGGQMQKSAFILRVLIVWLMLIMLK